ncbi:unnamed protein product [Durusdinium trenchii]|uniref:Uncharacterized protein n=1 Tax=Durusdinium trenchii TaxID=1381693 RepID=A0ABP0J4L7_9DINO
MVLRYVARVMRSQHGIQQDKVMTFRRGIQDQSEAWAKLYDKKEKEAMKVANPKETLRKMYDKLVTPKLQRHGASAPLPFEDESSRGNVTSSKEENAKKKAKKGDGKSASKKERERAKKKKKKKKSKKAKSTSSSSSSSTSTTSSN